MLINLLTHNSKILAENLALNYWESTDEKDDFLCNCIYMNINDK